MECVLSNALTQIHGSSGLISCAFINSASSSEKPIHLCKTQAGRDGGVGRGLGVGVTLGVEVGVAVGVGLTVAVGVAVGVAVAVAVGVGVGVGLAVAVGVGVAPPDGDTRT